ncbi:hypothetical protein [uncultured Nostoc sp.]|uniref:hypothetical protein n=1 Tax=uncultured Nostoc sp. TaxID=340711 RepID=UPI00262088B9|nr:hypothetical protein [uncultured Nostoc sp.]
MTTTVQQLAQKLQDLHDNAVIAVKTEDEQDFRIVDLRLEKGSLSIVITNEDEDDEEEEAA